MWRLIVYPAIASVLLVAILRWVDPPTSAFMLAAAVRGDAGGRIDFRWLDLEAMSPTLPLALIAAEDQRFMQHRGFDTAAIRAAMEGNRAGGRVRGASTITQQTAKNLFLWSGRSWIRKFLEAWFAAWMEVLWSKHRILEVYANVAEFGAGVYGAEAAARQYLGKGADDLDAAGSARLAAVLPNPRRYSAARPGAYVQSRTRWIQRQMRQMDARAAVPQP